MQGRPLRIFGDRSIKDPISTVVGIAGWHNLGLTPEEIAAKIEHLTLAQIHAALAYYYANREEIDADIASEEAAAEEIIRSAKPV